MGELTQNLWRLDGSRVDTLGIRPKIRRTANLIRVRLNDMFGAQNTDSPSFAPPPEEVHNLCC